MDTLPWGGGSKIKVKEYICDPLNTYLLMGV